MKTRVQSCDAFLIQFRLVAVETLQEEGKGAIPNSFSWKVAVDWVHQSTLMEEDQRQNRKIYHERNRLQFCLLHGLNNLLQGKDTFTRDELDLIANKLAVDDPNKQTWTPLSVFLKPHHNALTGNYDVNVLIAALGSRGRTVVWHDRRNRASSIWTKNPKDALGGFMLNVPVSKLGGLWRSRHWIALQQIDGVWYNLDSDLHVPELFEDETKLMGFIDTIIAQGGEVFVILHDKQ